MEANFTRIITCLLISVLASSCLTAEEGTSAASVHFEQPLRTWDGFGANYIEVRHTRDYERWPQDYSGFKYLTDQQRQEIAQLVFGRDGLRVSLLKMFLDPYHEPIPDNDDPHIINMDGFEHARSTESMRDFARRGLELTRARGDNLTVLAGLYAGPHWAIQQGPWGRDLIPEQKYELAEYMISWVKYLREIENVPVKFLSIHNEEAHRDNWDQAGYPTENLSTSRLDRGLTWPNEQITDFLGFMRNMLDAQGLSDVGLTPGETVFWSRLVDRGIAAAILDNPVALNNLGLITSHAFIQVVSGKFNEINYESTGIDMLRQRRPDLHAWTTSCKLDGYNRDEADIGFMEQFWLQIYTTGVNGIIPWATIHCQWESDRVMDGSFSQSGNRNSPIHVVRTSGNSGYFTVRKGYHFYKQLSRAGQAGMAVAQTSSRDAQVRLIAFSQNGTSHPDALVVINTASTAKALTIEISGTSAASFTGHITSEANFGDLNYAPFGIVPIQGNKIEFVAPPKGSIVLFANP